MSWRVEGIDHVALNVRNLEVSLAFYRQVLGLERLHEEAWGDRPAVIGAGTTALALFAADESEAGAEIRQGEAGMRHVAFRVDRASFEQAEGRLGDHGLEYTVSDHGIAWSIYFRDPDGYKLEITTYEVD